MMIGCLLSGLVWRGTAVGVSAQDDPGSVSSPDRVTVVEAYAFHGVRLFVEATDNAELLKIAASNPVPSGKLQGMGFDGAFWLDADKNIAAAFRSSYQPSTREGWSFFRDQTLQFPRNAQMVGATDRFLWQGTGGTFVAVRDLDEADQAHLSTVSLLREIIGFALEPAATFDQATTAKRDGDITDTESANERFDRVRSFRTHGTDRATTWLWYSPQTDTTDEERRLRWVFAIKEFTKGRTWLTVMEARPLDANEFSLPDEKDDIPEVYREKIEHFDLIRFLNAEEERAHLDRGSIAVDDTLRVPGAGPSGFRLAFVTISLLAWFRQRSTN